jgi:hypothetical protein
MCERAVSCARRDALATHLKHLRTSARRRSLRLPFSPRRNSSYESTPLPSMSNARKIVPIS